MCHHPHHLSVVLIGALLSGLAAETLSIFIFEIVHQLILAKHFEKGDAAKRGSQNAESLFYFSHFETQQQMIYFSDFEDFAYPANKQSNLSHVLSPHFQTRRNAKMNRFQPISNAQRKLFSFSNHLSCHDEKSQNGMKVVDVIELFWRKSRFHLRWNSKVMAF